MIHKIYCSDSRFRPIEFQTGLNIILADRKQSSGQKDSCNGTGKTTLLHIINFCLGGDLNKKVLPVNEINDWVFSAELDLFRVKFTIDRNIDNPGKIFIHGETSVLPISPQKGLDGEEFYTLDNWRTILGVSKFGLPQEKSAKYSPSFRSLVSYFIRTGIDAYSTPFSFLRNQKSWQIQIANSFFLGLNWKCASDIQILKDKNAAAGALETAIKVGLLSSKGELESERIRLNREIINEEKSLASFHVHPKYKEIQLEASRLTKEIHDITDENIILEKKMERYHESISEENISDSDKIVKLYQEAGVQFEGKLKRSLEEVHNFHSAITSNRNYFLQAELNDVKTKTEVNSNLIKELSDLRATHLSVLKAHGALEELTLLQGNLSEKKHRYETLRKKISEIQDISIKKKGFKVDRINIDSKILRDYEESRSHWEKAVDDFNENSQALYNQPGNLVINLSEKSNIRENAYKFDVDIPRSNSEGVGKMKIFCYDLVLAYLFSQQGMIDFLVHDSTMYDGVDSRQVAHALEHAHKKGTDGNFQYICAFNSDSVPHNDFSEGFNIDSHIRLRLTDEKPEESLLGFRFELEKKK